MPRHSNLTAYLNRPLFLAPFGQQDFVSQITGDLSGAIDQAGTGIIAGIKSAFTPGASSAAERKPYTLTPAMLNGNCDSEAEPAHGDKLWDWTDGSTAIIRINGPLLDRAIYYWDGELCRDGYDRIAGAVAQAQTDPMITGIMLQMDTPGGLVDGCFEAVRSIREMKQAGGKPIWASVCDCAASAGYALASACDTIIATETAITGSIGVIMLFTQTTVLHKKIGIETIPIQFGDYKTDGAGWKEFSEDEIGRLKSMIGELGNVFVHHVAVGRNLSPEAVIAQQAGIYAGQQGVAAGLVDAIGTRAEALAALQEFTGTSSVQTPETASAVRSNQPAK